MRLHVVRAIFTFLAVLVHVSSFQPAIGATGGTTVVYNNFGPNDTYANFGNWYGTHPGLNNAWNIVATAFTPSTSGLLTDITLGMRTSGDPNAGNLNAFVLSLHLDNNSKPGSSLWQQLFFDELALGPLSGGVTTLENVQGPLLTAGQRYWFVADTPADDTSSYQVWNAGLSGSDLVAHMNAFTFGWDVSSQTGNALRVAVIVPEPSSAAALGLAWLVSRRPRRRQASRHSTHRPCGSHSASTRADEEPCA